MHRYIICGLHTLAARANFFFFFPYSHAIPRSRVLLRLIIPLVKYIESQIALHVNRETRRSLISKSTSVCPFGQNASDYKLSLGVSDIANEMRLHLVRNCTTVWNIRTYQALLAEDPIDFLVRIKSLAINYCLLTASAGFNEIRTAA